MGTIFRMGDEIIRGNNLTINSSSLVFKWQQMQNFIILWQSEQKRNSFYLRKCAFLFTYDEMRQAMRCVCDDDGLSRVDLVAIMTNPFSILSQMNELVKLICKCEFEQVSQSKCDTYTYTHAFISTNYHPPSLRIC